MIDGHIVMAFVLGVGVGLLWGWLAYTRMLRRVERYAHGLIAANDAVVKGLIEKIKQLEQERP